MKKIRTDLPRFRVGDEVTVTETIMTRYANTTGTVVCVSSSRHASTLDKYSVLMSDGSQNTFWDVQLTPRAKLQTLTRATCKDRPSAAESEAQLLIA